MHPETIHYYDEHHEALCARYDTADMHELHALFEHYVPAGCRVMDIGFGSGRDLRYLNCKARECYGADASHAFVSRLQRTRPELADRLFHAALPCMQLPSSLRGTFDVLLCIGVWMHLPQQLHASAITELDKLLRPDGRVILSYSTAPRKDDPRFFEELDAVDVADAFERGGFALKEERLTRDGLGRELSWAVQVFESGAND